MTDGRGWLELFTRRRVGLAAGGLGLAALALVECGLQLRFEGRAPRPSDYDALVAPMDAIHQEGDLVLVKPAWAEPHVRRALGDAYFPRQNVGRASDARFARAIQVVLPSGDDEVPAGFRVVRSVDASPFTLRLLENAEFRAPTFDFVRSFGPRHVTARGTEPSAPCVYRENAKVATGRLGGPPAYPRERFECDTLATQVSRSFVADENFEPRDCIFAQPPELGERIVQFAKVPLGDVLEGHTLIHWMASRERMGMPVKMIVRVDGEVLGEVAHLDGAGWLPFRFDTGAHAGKSEATVEFVISSEGGERREFCFEAVSF